MQRNMSESIMTTRIMTRRPLPNYNQQKMIFQTKMQQQLFVAVGMIDEFYQTLISLL
jgi:precorrin-4 methylase